MMRKIFLVGMVLGLMLALAVPAIAKSPTAMAQDKVLFSDPQFVADYVRVLATIKGANAAKKGAKAAAISAAEQKKGAVAKKQMVAAGKDEQNYFNQRPAKQAASRAAAAKEEFWYNGFSFLPVVGDVMRSYASGQKRAAEYNCKYLAVTGKAGPKNADKVALADAVTKPLSNWPEGIVPATLYTPFRKNWRDQDPYSGLNAERSNIADGGVIVVKGLSMALPGAYAPVMGVNSLVAGPIENAFVWGGMVGIPANVATSYVEK